jgi:hypothetical protein
MVRRSIDLDILLLVATASFLIALGSPWSAPAGVAGVVLVVSGAVLAARAVLPEPLDVLARVVATVAIGLIVTIVAGLALNIVWTGLLRFNLLVFAQVIVLAAYGVARRRGGGRRLYIPGWLRRPNRRGVLMHGVVASMLCAVAVLTVFSAAHTREQEFAELWVLPVAPAEGQVVPTVRIGLTSHRSSVQAFTVQALTDGGVETYRIELEPGGKWEKSFVTSEDGAGARLYLGDPVGEAYRTVWLGRPGA